MGSEPSRGRDGGTGRILTLAAVAVAPSVGAACAFFLVPGPIGNAIYAGGKAVLYGVPALAWWREGRRVGRRPRGIDLLCGVAVGLAMAGGIVVAARLLGEAAIDPDRLRAAATAAGIDTPARFLALAAWLSFGNAFLEEFTFRGFIPDRLAALLPGRTWPVLLLAATIFAAHHLVVLLAYAPVPMAVLGSLTIAAAGLAWSLLRLRSGSLVPGWIAHAGADLAIFALGFGILFPPEG